VSRLGYTVANLLCLAVAVFLLGIAIAGLPETLRAARNEGVPGTFTVVRKECRPWWEKAGGCTHFGDFTSRDGTVRLTDVLFDGDAGDTGDTMPAQYVGSDDPPRIYGPGSNEWMFVAALGLGSAGYLGFRGWRAIRALRRKRAVTSATAG
jgi:hypothetical protein